jgi:hypothetical protein
MFCRPILSKLYYWFLENQNIEEFFRVAKISAFLKLYNYICKKQAIIYCGAMKIL